MILINCLFGIIWGSFCGVVATRLMTNESIVFPASHCDECNTPLQIIELIPIFSFIFLKGKCKHCNANISFYSTMIETLGLVTPLLLPKLFTTITESIIIWLLFLMSVCDLKNMLIPTWSIITLFVIVTINQIITNQFEFQTLIILLISYIIITIINNRQKFLGAGDVDVIFILLSWLKLISTIKVLFYASLAALLFYILFYSTLKKRLPFVPFLLLGLIIIKYV